MKQKLIIGSWENQSLPTQIQIKGRSDMHLWERKSDDGPHHIQMYKDKISKRHTQTSNK
jgi:hypothetical protein